ncbi:DUF3310 domain-containing protein [Lysinibacillus sp. SGAir0095]|uniref:DUF3310 domain-containing protein n=1 Tax=Lysinibacillus sp. SGAir0095 TaxID=2070463 RepID=UPI0010CCD29B|nr:DUF3310 domain-containing protein [Lysinibacillus sp. SGAir0095]QCR33144.1 hypothetical protein C1N55_13560 [Lysinibacillus sp. SGAir0095]
MNKLYQLEHLVNNGGSQEEIDELRAELGITITKKKDEKKPESEKKMVLTVEAYRELKAKGKSDSLIMSEYNMHSPKFYEWKKKHGLINARKSEKVTEVKSVIKTETLPIVVAADQEKQLVVLEEVPERPGSAHYHTGNIDVWMFADENFSWEEVLGFHRIDAIKYLARYGKKEGYNLRDLEKAQAEINKLIEMHNKRPDR